MPFRSYPVQAIWTGSGGRNQDMLLGKRPKVEMTKASQSGALLIISSFANGNVVFMHID